MSTIDIRYPETEKFNRIVFADRDYDYLNAHALHLKEDNTVVIASEDTPQEGIELWIRNSEDAIFLIRALEKVIEKGWFKE